METGRLALRERRSSPGRRFQYSVDLHLNGFDLSDAGTGVCGGSKPQREHCLDAKKDCKDASPSSGYGFRLV